MLAKLHDRKKKKQATTKAEGGTNLGCPPREEALLPSDAERACERASACARREREKNSKLKKTTFSALDTRSNSRSIARDSRFHRRGGGMEEEQEAREGGRL